MGKRFKSWCIFSFLLLFIFLGVVRVFGAEQPGEEEVELVSPAQEEIGFQGLWVQRQEAISTEGAMAGEQQLEEIVNLKFDKGIVNLWGYALLLIREGIKLEDKNKAMKLGEFSQRMAPDLPYVYFYTGQIIWEKERWRVYPTLEKYFEGIRAYTRNLPLATGQGLNLLYLLGLGALLAVLAFCVLVLFKRLPVYIHALKEELTGERYEMIRGVGRIFLLFLPFLLRLNIIWCGLFWCLILWGYLTRGERGVLVLSLFLVTYISPVGKALFTSVEGPEIQTVFDIYETTYGEREPKALERLQLWSQGHPRDRDALFTVALAFKREGDYTAASRYYQKVMGLNPTDPDAISNLGNLYLALGEPEKAIKLYEQAIEVNPYNGVYYFNLSKALSQKSMLLLQDADKNFQRAKELSPKIIGAHLEIDSPHPNRSVIDEIIPLERLRRRFFAELWRRTGPSFLILDVWLRNLSPRFPFISPLVFFVLFIILSYVSKGRMGWWRCSLCGLTSTQTYARKEGRKTICIRCFRLLKGKEMDKGLKETKLKEIKVFQRRSGLYERLVPIILPGGGHIWKGYNLRGLFFFWIFFVFLGKFYYWKGIVPPPIPSAIYGIYGGGLLITVVFAIFYLLVLKGAYKKAGLEVFEPPFPLEGIRR
ncbi:MAG: tetratricopeptide repeat protein [Deltaproteobacteria bacterium]|nr:tetratricopeptide repeat protein [Deltaproteobacteria bacterium]